jgi:hypothetical protein
MNDVVIPFATTSLLRRAMSLREMARARRVEAVRQLETGHRDVYWNMLKDVAGFESEALRLERQAARIDDMKRHTIAAIDAILKRAGS